MKNQIVNKLAELIKEQAAPNTVSEIIYDMAIDKLGASESLAIAISEACFNFANELADVDIEYNNALAYVPTETDVLNN